MTTERDKWFEIARGNVERNLSDAVAEDCEDPEGASADLIYDEAYTLAVDALIDAGCERTLAQSVAMSVAQGFAQP